MIPYPEVHEAAVFVRLAADRLLVTSDDQVGRAGSDLRRACGDIQANAEAYITQNQIAVKLAGCFRQALLTGATLDEFDRIRSELILIAAVSQTAILIKQACINFSLQQMARALTGMTFTSRADVDLIMPLLNDAFKQAEETVADEMAQTAYMGLVTLHAAVMFHLYETARPLPQMLNFQFAAIRPTLVQSYRLYADASRADQLRQENKVVHPAFAPRVGQALSF
jgi:hypothetical protein